MYCVFLIPSSVIRPLGCFHVLAIVNSAAMKFRVHMFFRIMTFSGHVSTSVQFSLVTQSCLTLRDPMNRSTPGLLVHLHL